MASRFVSAGAIDPTTGEAAAAAAATAAGAGTNVPPSSSTATQPPPRASPPSAAGRPTLSGAGQAQSEPEETTIAPSVENDRWLAAQKELEAERQRRQEQRTAAAAGGEKSLYDVLQANKAAKQVAFEEANKIKNQFRPLDDDEIDFLDGVRARLMEEESALRRETEERLRVFREAQKGSGSGAEAEPGDDGLEVEKEGEKEEWGPVGRKRKREKEKPWGKGIVKRKVSQAQKAEETGSRATGGPGTSARVVTADGVVKGEKQSVSKNSSSEAPTPSKSKLGLVSYGSDDDDEEEDD